MNNTNTVPFLLDASITLGEVLGVSLTDRRPESLEFFGQLEAAHRGMMAADVWQIGLRALQMARASANTARLEDVGAELLAGLQERLAEHVQTQAQAVQKQLALYFDPSDGRLMARLEALFKDGGQLARVIEQQTGPTSALATTLMRQVSPLLQKLSPTETDGVVQVIGRKVEEVLRASQQSLQLVLDPATTSSAAGRFLGMLKQEIAAAGETQEKRLAAVAAVLDANDVNSPLSRLLRETHEAQQRVLAAVTPGHAQSLLAPLQETLTGLIERHQKQQAEAFEAQRQRQEAFEREIQAAVQRIELRKEQARRGVAGGREFEEEVHAFVSVLLQGGAYVVDFTGNKKSAGMHRKVGDVVITFTEESAFAGAKVVIEAKRKDGYTLRSALDELSVARQNRDAAVGLFVMSSNAAPAGFPPFARYGHNVVVMWDSEDRSTDAYLHAAALVALALASRTQRRETVDEAVELEALCQRVQGELARIERIRGKATTVLHAAKAIQEEVNKGQEELAMALTSTRKLLDGVKAERSDEAAESQTPITAAMQLSAEGIELGAAAE